MQVRILKKKMQQIEALQGRGTPLDPQQRAKVMAKPLLESALALLETGTPLGDVQALLAAAKDGALLLCSYSVLLLLVASINASRCPDSLQCSSSVLAA